MLNLLILSKSVVELIEQSKIYFFFKVFLEELFKRQQMTVQIEEIMIDETVSEENLRQISDKIYCDLMKPLQFG